MTAFAFQNALGGQPSEWTEGPAEEPAKQPSARPPQFEAPGAISGPDPKEIMRATTRIYHAVEGVGTDEGAVLAALQNRSPEEISALREAYKKRHGQSLDAVLADELDDEDLEAARLALAGNKVGAAAATIAAAVAGIGADARLILATLRSIPDAEGRTAVAQEVMRRTGKSIHEIIREELGGKNRDQAELLLAGKRAEASAVALQAAMEGAGTDERAIFAALESAKNRAEREAIVQAYEARTGRSLDADLFEETSGDELGVVTSEAVGDEAGAAASKASLAMGGLGTDERLLSDALEGSTVAQSGAIREAYAGLAGDAGRSIDSDLRGELSGSEKLDIGTMLANPTGPAFGSAEFERGLDESTNSKAREGNKVDMLFDGSNSFPERFKMIDEATKSINLQTFIFNDDATGWAMATKLAAKAKEGLQVRVIYDAVGSGRADEKIFDMMRAAGVEVREYGNLMKDPLSANKREHEKQLIVDGQASVQGGMNIADEYALGGSGKPVASRGNEEAWRDADIKMEGPSVQDAQTAFLKMWGELGEDVSADDRDKLMQPAAPVEGGSSVRVVQHRPDQDGDDNIENLYLKCVRSSTTNITIENAYFMPSDELKMELIAAAKRGVKVRVMTNSRESNDAKPVADASRFFYDDLAAAGVDIFEKQGGTLHAKTASFDGAYSIVGSANLNSRSREHDAEIVLGIQDPSVAAQLDQRFEKGLEETVPVTMKELANEGLGDDVRQKLSSLASGIM